jgi:hypothetical protein
MSRLDLERTSTDDRQALVWLDGLSCLVILGTGVVLKQKNCQIVATIGRSASGRHEQLGDKFGKTPGLNAPQRKT